MKLMKKICIVTSFIMIFIIGVENISAADYWQGTGYYNTQTGEYWGVTENQIMKVENPGNVYDVSDIMDFSAYATNINTDIGNEMPKSVYWYNKSRLLYVKLLKVTGGQEISFVFSNSVYICCAEYDSNFKLINDGAWHTIGDKFKLMNNTSWIMVIFRCDNGDLSSGAGTNTSIELDKINKLPYKYIVFSPFTYRFNLNGGTYMGLTAALELKRHGVEKITLPIPERVGYVFKGWKYQDGTIYNGIINEEYDEKIFKNSEFTAVWEPIKAQKLILSDTDVVLEQNSGDSISLKATVIPENTLDKNITWYSDNENVASVDKNGKISAYNTGIATITATTENGISSSCTVYVMGFEISVPAACTLMETYEININVYNNGHDLIKNRKHILIDTDENIKLCRVGDEKISYNACAEYLSHNDKTYKKLKTGEYLANVVESEKILYRLTPAEKMEKAGDYEGIVNFTVSVR